MSVVSQLVSSPNTDSVDSRVVANLEELLREYFDCSFALWDGTTGEVLHRTQDSLLDELGWSPLVRVVAERGAAEVIDEAEGIAVLAIPLTVGDELRLVATAPFLTEEPRGEVMAAAALRGTTCQRAQEWAAGQQVWPEKALLKLARAAQERVSSEQEQRRLTQEVELLSANLASTYEEISLIYAVTQNLRISSTDDELGRMAIEWLGECVRAQAFAVMYLPLGAPDAPEFKPRAKPRFITSGDCPVDPDQFMRLIESLRLDASAEPYVSNDCSVESHGGGIQGVRQMIAVPLVEGENVFGWIAAFNHAEEGAFGTVEANLLRSLGTLLGIHAGNRELYRQQSELLADIVRALVSAIDAKDPYTSGHSDRVARFAVRIALEMRCNPKFVNTIYMAGLLHDIGKIGIDDNVLRKAGRLNDAEFEHIKKHPELGYRILADLRPLAEVLPAVLHHHEQWNGRGYPLGLSRQDIPLIARILAVADAYDAMTSDRPYRAGMPEEKVYEIFREGAGQHWDPEVIAAFFRAKEDMRRISQRQRPQIDTFRQQLL